MSNPTLNNVIGNGVNGQQMANYSGPSIFSDEDLTFCTDLVVDDGPTDLGWKDLVLDSQFTEAVDAAWDMVRQPVIQGSSAASPIVVDDDVPETDGRASHPVIVLGDDVLETNSDSDRIVVDSDNSVNSSTPLTKETSTGASEPSAGSSPATEEETAPAPVRRHNRSAVLNGPRDAAGKFKPPPRASADLLTRQRVMMPGSYVHDKIASWATRIPQPAEVHQGLVAPETLTVSRKRKAKDAPSQDGEATRLVVAPDGRVTKKARKEKVKKEPTKNGPVVKKAPKVVKPTSVKKQAAQLRMQTKKAEALERAAAADEVRMDVDDTTRQLELEMSPLVEERQIDVDATTRQLELEMALLVEEERQRAEEEEPCNLTRQLCEVMEEEAEKGRQMQTQAQAAFAEESEWSEEE